MLLSQVLYSIVLTAAFGTINYTPILTKKKLSDKSYKNLVNIRESVWMIDIGTKYNLHDSLMKHTLKINLEPEGMTAKIRWKPH